MNAQDEKIRCMLCDMCSTNLNSHITRTHKMKLDEYRHKFPGAQTCKLTNAQLEKMIATKSKKDSVNKQKKAEAQKRVEDLSNEFDTLLSCNLCEFTSQSSLISHITRSHKMKMIDYRIKFPNAIVQRSSKATKDKISKNTKEIMARPDIKTKVDIGRSFPSEIKHWTRKGLTDSEAVEMVSNHQKMLAARQNNPVTKQKQHENSAGDINPMSLQSISIRHDVSISEARKLTPCYGRTGEEHPMFGKKHTEEALRKIGENITGSNISEAERKFAATMPFSHKRNIPIQNYICDVVATDKKFIIEFFGNYWHANPKLYETEWINPTSKLSAIELRARDNKKLQSLRDAGYTVVVVWEQDWKYDRDNVIKEITNAYNRT